MCTWGVAVRYRLPLASLLPPAIDEKTGESFPGNYQFSFHLQQAFSRASGRGQAASRFARGTCCAIGSYRQAFAS